ncbi:MAG: calcium/sodium antiporter [Rhodocyclaceae bacterium]|nr:calcium/sodium antiporter [Rhodocyclaceae bacterium]
MELLFFILGLVCLVIGAELLVRGAGHLALSFGISPLVVGLTVVAFGTSTPELAVSMQAAWADKAGIALGNVVGSNIVNVLLILGISAVIVPLMVANQLIRQEVPIMIGFSLLVLMLAFDGQISRLDGALFVALLVSYTVFIVRQSRRQGLASSEDLPAPTTGWRSHWGMQAALIVAGLGLLVLGAHWLVEAAIAFAQHLGISEVVIGLTVVAIGTSLPEIVTSIVAALRGQRDIAVGNVVGSNIFNIAGVLGLSSVVAPSGINVHPSMLSFDIPVMIGVAIACLPIFFTGNLIARWEGTLFLGGYAAYVAYLLLAAREHDALATFAPAMTLVVLPLTALTLAVFSWREWRSRHPGNTSS